jgi:hypothetical protein
MISGAGAGARGTCRAMLPHADCTRPARLHAISPVLARDRRMLSTRGPLRCAYMNGIAAAGK